MKMNASCVWAETMTGVANAGSNGCVDTRAIVSVTGQNMSYILPVIKNMLPFF